MPIHNYLSGKLILAMATIRNKRKLNVNFRKDYYGSMKLWLNKKKMTDLIEMVLMIGKPEKQQQESL